MNFFRRAQPPIRSLIGEGTVVCGELRFSEGLRIDGEVQGDVIADTASGSLLVISEKALVRGKVNAAHVIINGRIEGPVVSSTLLELQPKACIVGDVRYEVLEMHPGATIDGSVHTMAPAEKPPLKLAASNQG